MIVVERLRPDDEAHVGAIARLIGAYLVATEREKGADVAGVDDLPGHYRLEVDDPVAAFREATVLLARVDGEYSGCAVLHSAARDRGELKRLWAEPSVRGRGVAGALIDAAVESSRTRGDIALRLTVWKWRSAAVGLYRRRGFADVPAWDPRPDLLFLELPLAP